jgi:hypothetical protein
VPPSSLTRRYELTQHARVSESISRVIELKGTREDRTGQIVREGVTANIALLLPPRPMTPALKPRLTI